MTTEYIISEELATKVCAILINYGENRVANKLCSRPAPSRNIDVSKCFEDIVYSSTPWKIYRQDAGMGEHDYAVFLNDVFYCRTDDSQTATRIINTMRSPAPFEPKFDSTDLLLLANDEWKRREERKQKDQYLITESDLYVIIEWLSGKKYQDCEVDSMLYKIRNSSTEGKWIGGFLNGFCTSKDWARKYVDKLLKEKEKVKEG